MAYRPGGYGGGMNMNALMQQAKKMQEQMERAQAELEDAEIVGKAGGEMVVVTMNGNKDIQSIKLHKAAVDPDDKEKQEQLIVVAIKDASKRVDDLKKEKMGGMGGLGGLM